MDSVTAGIVTGAIIAIISGFLTLVAFNSKELWRWGKKCRIKRIVTAARVVLENAAIKDPPNHKIVKAVTDIALRSKEGYYLECFDWNDREQLARLLGENGRVFREKGGVVQALDFLKRTLKDEDVDVRIAAVTALGNICHAKTVPALIQALRDSSPYIRQQAAATLRELTVTKPEDIDAIIRALQDTDPSVRRAAAEALGEIEGKRATSYLIRALKDYEWYVRREAAQALGKIKDSQAIPYLIRSAREGDADVRAAAIAALAPFGDPANQALFDARVVEVFKEAKQDEDEVIQAATPAFHNFENAVLIVGNVTEGQIEVFDVIRKQLSKLDYIPIALDLEKPNWSGQKAALAVAGMVRFIIVDFTVGGPSIQLMRDIVSRTCDVPLVPLRRKGGMIPSTLQQLKEEHECILSVHVYKDADDLLISLREQVIEPAEAKVTEIVADKQERIG
jgi:HEAT repeat protein